MTLNLDRVLRVQATDSMPAAMRILVTGGAGFIGSNLVDALLARGDEVAVIDNLSTGRRSNLEGALAAGAVLHEADISDAERMRELVAEIAPSAVFHLAAQIDVRKSVREVAFDARINVEGTINMLDAAHAAQVGRFVFISTGGAIYGETDRLPTPEDETPRPLAPYGQSKFCAEGYCGLYARLHGLPAVVLRLGNVYGPRQDPLGEAGVVAIFAGKLLDGEVARINGDGRQTRDYVFVGDVVSAALAALEHPEATGAYNIGTGIETTVLAIAAALATLAGPKGFRTEHAQAPAGEVGRSCLDPGRAARELGWRSATSLADGMRVTLDATRAARGG
jgi:UDP-glucose 4-epimerase